MEHYDYIHALYRRNNFGQPCMWYCFPSGLDNIVVVHGIVGKTYTYEYIKTHRNTNEECQSRINAKRKVGYKTLFEIRDDVTIPVEGELYNYLDTYLERNITTTDGSLLPMLAKVYDNTNNNVFKNCSSYIGQYKINGLRCFISAYSNTEDMFNPIKLKFQSREGIYWNSLSDLEDYLLIVLDSKLLDKMVEEHYILDGEIYLPGYSVNEINHFVKTSNCKENKLLQFWCYDIAIEETVQEYRNNYLLERLNNYVKIIKDKDEHLNNTNRLVILPSYTIIRDTQAMDARDTFIKFGFEGLILRNPDKEYQYGKRNSSMIKYKKSTDGIFNILEIVPEGIKRNDIPLIICKNDINDSRFSVHVCGSIEYQKQILKDKEKYIGKQMFIEYGERSGVTQVPFHVKTTRII